ncbi:YcnI family protein [Nocardia sp. NPDC058176]|uniref:YcnI family copper-binding membrane protein n=1 Tax=Nocardia sp. NPDC058176 TaxID=3346368 RepID=UPI0036DB3762
MRRAGWVVPVLVAPLLLAAPANAHVTAVAPDAAPGAYTVVTLRVPTESATASTVGLEVDLPRDQPLAVVRNETTPGWDVVLRSTRLSTPIDNGHGKKIGEAVSTVTFTARDGSGVAPGEFAEFRLLLGPFPESGVLTLPTRQTYSDGTVVGWIEQSVDGTEADKPAPEIRLTGGGHAGAHGNSSPPAVAAAAPSGWSDSAGLAVSLVALVIAGLAFFVRGRRTEPPAPTAR